MRDREKQRNYDAEDSALEGTVATDLVSVEQLSTLTARICGTLWWAHEAVGREVTVATTRGARSRAFVALSLVKIAKGHNSPAVLAHELAHIASGPLGVGHGPRFRACHIAILSMISGPEVAELLARGYKKAGLVIDDLSVEPDMLGPSGLLGGSTPPDANDVWVRRVQKLLAKAESTSHLAEAESLRAKAVELISTHRIDLARVEIDESTERKVVVKNLSVAATPYMGAWSSLLSTISSHYDCGMFWVSRSSGRLFSVAGHPSDVSLVLYTFTSLVSQSAAELELTETAERASGRTLGNMLAWRRSFYLGFVSGVASRFRDIAREYAAARAAACSVDASAGEHTLEIELVARRKAVADYMSSLRLHSATGYAAARHAAAYSKGHAAASRATLGARPERVQRSLGTGR